MKTPMFMFAPDTAVADAPATTEAAPAAEAGKTNIGESAGAAFSRLNFPKGEPAESAASEDQKAKVGEKPKVEAKPKATPKNALDALLSAEPKAEAAKEEPSEELSPEEAAALAEKKAFEKEMNVDKLRERMERGWNKVAQLQQRLSASPKVDPKLTEELTTLRASIAEREAKLAEYDAKMAEYKDAMALVNVELDPDHRREFIDGRKALVEGAASKFKTYGGNPEEMAEALALPEGRRRDEAIDNLTSDLPDTAKAKILTAIAKVEELDERKAAALANPHQTLEEYQRKQTVAQQRQAQEAEQYRKAEFDRVSRELAKTVPTLGFADESLEGGKEWNAARSANSQAAIEFFSKPMTPEQSLTISIKGHDYDRVTALFMESRKTIAEQAARLAELEGAMPDAKARKAPVLTKEQQNANKTPGERYRELATQGASEDY